MLSYPVVLLILGAYLLGSIPFALVIGLARGVDIRKSGSGNVGATNLARTAGRLWGLAAFALDYSKGLLPVLASARLGFAPPGESTATATAGVEWIPLAAGAAAVLGHVFPLYLGFRGGKGVATAFGVMTGLSWPATAAAGGLWLIIFAVTRTVSVASIAAALALPAGVALLGRQPEPRNYLPVLVFSFALAALILVRHRTNIGRLWRGEEHHFR